VVATERHDARRIDRQLFGRCGRQGDPGTHEAIVSLEDELVMVYAGRFWRWASRLTARPGHPALGRIAALAFRQAQRGAERAYSRARQELLKLDEHLESALAFSGRRE